MSEPGQRQFGEDLAPKWHILVNQIDLMTDISARIKQVEYESTIEMADALTLTINNPYFALKDERNLVNHKAFQPGNEVELWLGYGRADTFIGRGLLQRHSSRYPADSTPQIVVKAYDKSFLMMKAAGDLMGAMANKIKLKEPRPQDKKDNQGKTWKDIRHSQIVEIIAKKYGFKTDIAATTTVDTIVQKKGMTDYALCKGLANLNGREFWVDYHPIQDSWILHWQTPRDTQRATYEFWYGVGDKSTLLDCEVEYSMAEPITTLQVLAWDWYNEKWVTACEIQDVESADPTFKAGSPPRIKGATSNETIEETISSASQFRLAASGTAIDVITDHQFKDVQSLAKFASQWFLERKNNFLIATGSVIGVETLMAGQVHNLKGLGLAHEGPYYFVNVNHRISDDGGYICDFTARKVLDS